MNKQDFSDNIKGDHTERKEMEALVQKYANKIAHVQPLLKASMIVGFREGFIALLDMLDSKALAIKQEKQKVKQILEETRGTV